MLVNYSSSSCEESDVDENLKGAQLAGQTLQYGELKCKRAKIATDESTKYELPKAVSQLGPQKTHREVLENENPAKHGGRIRGFKHERGNWATYVYIPVVASTFEEMQELCREALADVVDLQLPTDELHISLSRTVVLQHHFIDSFIKSLKEALEVCASFSVCLRHLKIYTNEKRTRTFLAFKIDSLYFEKLRNLLTKVDAVMKDYKMPQFYKDPIFHVSFLWCLGDKVQLLNFNLDKLMNAVKTSNEQESLSLNVSEIYCKTGNKQFTFNLNICEK